MRSQIRSSSPCFRSLISSATAFLVAGLLVLGLTGCDAITGSDDGPIEISTIEELQEIGDDEPLDGVYELTDNIDASGVDFDPIGNWEGVGSEANRPFNGRFEGNGFTITGLTINRPEDNGVGLFAMVNGAGERGVVNLEIENPNITGNDRVGALAGVNVGQIESVEVVGGEVTGGQFAGGLVGVNFFSIERSSATATVQVSATTAGGLAGANASEGNIQASFADGTVEGSRLIGGLVGFNNGATVSDSYARGTADASNQNVGGLIGRNEGIIDDSYAAVDVGAPAGVGGLIGLNEGTLSDTYWNQDLRFAGIGDGSDTGATGLETDEMQGDAAADNMELDFENTWSTVSDDYPELLWEQNGMNDM